VKFNGKGCAISQASASMLTDEIIGKSIDEIKKLDKKFILDLLGIPLGPSRIKCALLPLKVIKAGVYGVGTWNDEEDE
jgi:nitrogen fixation NifU-like protein